MISTKISPRSNVIMDWLLPNIDSSWSWQLGNGVRVTSKDEAEIDLPGFDPNNIEITVEGEQLNVHAKSSRKTYTRCFWVPEGIDVGNIKAKYEHGVLKLKFPMLKELEQKKIKIEVG